MKSLTLCVASKNPVKVAAARSSFEQVFSDFTIDIVSVDAPSGVAEQPMSCEETLQGATNRVKHCQRDHNADYYISFEGGVDVIDQVPSTYAVVCIADAEQQQTGRTGNLPLPIPIYQALLKGGELGPEMDAFFKTHNIKQKGGAIGQLTGGLCTRQSIYTSTAIMTLAPFVYPELYISQTDEAR
ncbi:inosine/xanthosine triphosphatase [Glaciecola sp. KUL10]|uniref:inosine/xanthosine triphosphatase n=1 Tax=Glaciecola sp. (strain KUL10) TaxID=2161813 RepID=UPI000D7849C4|nr:inosine/xanthosine triphosphatase [Glaciecola sp. KUL10]GBL04383.1 non-canonical purine NTP phosphatase [Glaciecola sp. KUL10]